MSKTFKQAEWGYVNGVSMPTSGCGPCSVASIVYNKDTSITPVKVAKKMNELIAGSFSSGGSTRAGISKVLNHYGYQCLYFTPEHTGNAEWETALDMLKLTKDHKVWGIVLCVGMKNGGKDNKWTNGGHFLSITDYKDGKLYVRDSGSKDNTGYFNASDLEFDCNAMWVICPTY